MIQLDGGRRLVATRQCWFPASADDALDALAQAPLVDVMQCPTAVADALAPWAWRVRDFHTLLIDLSLDETALWNRFEKRTCRYQLRRAEKLAPEVWHRVAGAGTGDADARTARAARTLIDAFIARKGYRRGMGDREWARQLANAELFVVAHQGQAVAAHVVLVDGVRRARAVMSATVDRADHDGRALAGALNRWLHWHELRHLRARGVACYDFGGLFREPDHPDRAIDQFKLMFGGAVVTERIVRLCRWAALRAVLRVAIALRRSAVSVTPPPLTAEAEHGAA